MLPSLLVAGLEEFLLGQAVSVLAVALPPSPPACCSWLRWVRAGRFALRWKRAAARRSAAGLWLTCAVTAITAIPDGLQGLLKASEQP